MNNYRITAKDQNGKKYSFNTISGNMEKAFADAKQNAPVGHRVFLITIIY